METPALTSLAASCSAPPATGTDRLVGGSIPRGSLQLADHLAATVLISVVTLLLFAPLAAGQSYSAVGGRMFHQYPWAGTIGDGPAVTEARYAQTDQADALYPVSVFVTSALRRGEFPLWIPAGLGGVPVTAMSLLGFLYPPRLALMLVLAPSQQHDALLFGHLLLAGLGMYALLRQWSANAVGAVLGAVVWELSAYNTSWLITEQVVIAAAWLPIMLLAATVTIRRRSVLGAAATGVALGIGTLGGNLATGVIGALVLIAWIGMCFAGTDDPHAAPARRGRVKLFLLAIGSILLGLLICAPLWLPLVTSWRDLQPQFVSPATALGWGEIGRGLLSPTSSPKSAGLDLPSLAFVGYPALLFAVVGLLRPRPATILAAGVGVGGALLATDSLGMGLLRFTSPWLVYLPPHAGLFALSFSLAVLAALGITNLRAVLGPARLQVWRILAHGAIAITIWQLVTFATAVNPVQPRDSTWLFPATPLIERLRAVQQDSRVLPVGPVLLGNTGLVAGVRSAASGLPLALASTAALTRTITTAEAPPANPTTSSTVSSQPERLPLPLLDALSLGLIATAPGVIPSDSDGRDLLADGTLRLIYRGDDGWLYQNVRALPRAFIAPAVREVGTDEDALDILQDPSFDPSAVAIVVGSPAAAAVASRASGAAQPAVKVSPNPVHPAAGDPILSWDSGDGAEAQVWVSQDTGSERLVAQGPRGSQTVPWIQSNSTYIFSLYAGADHRALLATTAVQPAAGAAMLPTTNQSETQVASAGAQLSVTPNPVPADNSTSTIAWSSGDGAEAQVWVSQDNGPEQLVAQGAQGSQTVSWIQPSSTYVLRLYASDDHTTVLASTIVAGEVARAPAAESREPQLAAAPNPVPADSSTTTISWDSGNGSDAQVWVSENNQPEQLWTQGARGSQTVSWIQPNSTYVFRLYAGGDRATSLASTVVTRAIPALRELPGASAASGALASTVGLTLQDAIVDGSWLVRVGWRTQDGGVGQVWVSEAGGSDVLAAAGSYGVKDLPWVQPDVTYVFQLYAGTDNTRLVDLRTLRLDSTAIGRPRAAGRYVAEPPPVVPPVERRDDAATVVQESANQVTLEVKTRAPGVLVLNDAWTPDWRATVDGIEKSVFPTNYAFRGVLVPSGTHHVTFRYEPLVLRLSIIISAAAFVLALGLFTLRGVSIARCRWHPLAH